MSLGVVMFWKAVVLAVWVASLERWRAYKAAKAVNLVRDPLTGRYVPDRRLERLETWARRIFWTLFALFVAFAVVVSLILIELEGQAAG